MGIDLRRADALVAQQRLNHSEVGTSFEQGGGKRVSQRVGRDGLLDACRLRLPLDHNEDHHPRQVCPTTVQKYVVLLAGLDVHMLTVVEPEPEFLYGLLRDGHQPLLRAFAHHSDELLVEIEIRQL